MAICNKLYFTSITQKAHGTYKRVLDVRVCSLAWGKKPENPGKTTDFGLETKTLQHAYTRPKRQQANVLPLRFPGPSKALCSQKPKLSKAYCSKNPKVIKRSTL